jgi:hypothetical protein
LWSSNIVTSCDSMAAALAFRSPVALSISLRNVVELLSDIGNLGLLHRAQYGELLPKPFQVARREPFREDLRQPVMVDEAAKDGHLLGRPTLSDSGGSFGVHEVKVGVTGDWPKHQEVMGKVRCR